MGFGLASMPVLTRLEQAMPLAAIRWPSLSEADEAPDTQARVEVPSSSTWLEREWPRACAVVAVGACGLLTRLIAPLLGDKGSDPAVVVVDPQGRFVIPLLGGHGAGAERMSMEIAALLGGQPVLTGSSAAVGRLGLDHFGWDWGWQRGRGDWRHLMVQAAAQAASGSISVLQDCGNTLWHQLQAGNNLEPCSLPETSAQESCPIPLVISHRLGAGCRWHPPCLWLGIGCERGTSLSLLERLVEHCLVEHGLAEESVAGLASVSIKRDEQALLALAVAKEHCDITS